MNAGVIVLIVMASILVIGFISAFIYDMITDGIFGGP